MHAPLIVSWPAAPEGLRGRGLRGQSVFVSDLAPTLLELAGIPPLPVRSGKPALEFDGRSFAAALADAASPGRDLQHFEAFGSRALVSGRWKALSPVPPTPAEGATGGRWELYDLASDPTETRDRASEFPDTVRELAENWRDEAWRNTVFPLNDDGSLFSIRPESESALSRETRLTPFRPPLERFRASKLTVLRSFTVIADLEIEHDTEGVVVAHGDQGGGYLLAIEDGAPLISYNAYGDMRRVRAAPLGHGTHQVELRFAEIESLRWRITLLVDGRAAAEIPEVPMLLGMAPFTGISVGYDYGGPVDWELAERHADGFRFARGVIVELRYLPGQRSRHDRTVLHRIGEAALAVAD